MAIFCLLAWVIVFILEYHFLLIHGNIARNNDFFPPLVALCIQSVMVLVSAFLVAFPTKFTFYGFLCIARGLIQIIEGGGLPGMLMLSLGLLFFNKADFFKKHKMIKITVLSILLFLAICTQYRYGSYKLSETFLHLFSLVLMGFLAYILYMPEINAKKIDSSQQTICLSSDKFTLRDVSILKSIQKGEKYEVIAKNENIAVITLKKRARTLFVYLKVYDKNTFLTKYGNHPIVLEDTKKLE